MSETGLADLHRHLDGSLRWSTLEELAKEYGVRRLPPRRHLRFRRGMGLADALAMFRHTLSVLQHPAAVKRVASEICEDAAEDGVTTLEIRFAPQLHLGAEVEEIVDAALEGIDGRAGLILCGLYGESPDVLERNVECAKDRPGVVGIDLAGGPSATQRWIMEDYKAAFHKAADYGIGRTVHAAEGRSPDEIQIAVNTLLAQRIGHGTTLLEDDSILELVLDCNVTIEACPTSNVHTGALGAVEEHPMKRWIEAGVRVCVNTDNTLLSDVTASQELRNAAKIRGITDERLAYLVKCGHEAAFSRK